MNAFTFFCGYILLTHCAHASSQHLICKHVENVFESSESESADELPKGDCNDVIKAGKRGPRGFQGPPGPTGPPGMVGMINEQLQQELQNIKDQLKCSGGVIVDRICYKLPRRVGVKLSYDEAERMCIFHGGVLAQLPTEESYNAVVTYTKRMFSIDIDNKERDFMRIWLSSTFQDNQVQLRNGRRGYASWFPSYPSQHVNNNRMGIHLPIKPEAPAHQVGMFNIDRGYAGDIFAICEFSLDENI
ncbi:unnamed protein product [Clavelina lepadiformis]|uniref:C-type lectin domain-containing protein n=1 Tax=Clavelina lepadiformis TaxID=159417 RepID=A0ABP0GCE5_CLALP